MNYTNDWACVPKLRIDTNLIYNHIKNREFDWFDYDIPKKFDRKRHTTYDNVESGEMSLGPDFDYRDIVSEVKRCTGAIVANPVTDIKILSTKSGLKRHVDQADRPFTVITPLNSIANQTHTVFYTDETCSQISSILTFRDDSKMLKTSKWHEVIQQTNMRRDTLMVIIRDTSNVYPYLKAFFGIQ